MEEPPAAQHAQELPPHVFTAQCIDERVQCRVQGGDPKEDVGVAEDGTAEHTAVDIKQQDAEGRQPAHNKHAQDNGDGLEQSVGSHVSGFLVARTDNQVDTDIQDDNGEQDDAEDGYHKADVALRIERQDG